jgi:hypothetical protein
MYKWSLAIALIALLAISIFLRQGFSNKANIDNSANMLNFMQAWQAHGIANCYFSPTNTYNNIGDRNMEFWPGLIDNKGRCYYNSFPPFSFIITYAIIQTFHLDSSKDTLLHINLFFQLCCCLFLMGIIYLLLPAKNMNAWLSNVIAIAFFIFSPISAFFFYDYFFIENFSLVALLLASFLATLYILQPNRKYFILLLLAIFMLCFTELIGYLFCGILVYILFTQKTKRYWLPLVPALIAMFLTLFLYGSISGSTSLIKNFAMRFVARSGYFGNQYTENGLGVFSLSLYQSGIELIYNGFLPFIIITVGLSIVTITKYNQIVFANLRTKKQLLVMVLLPVLLHILFFLNANLLHQQLMIKILIPLSIIMALCLFILLSKSNSKIIFNRWLWLCILGLPLSIQGYSYFFNSAPTDPKLISLAKSIAIQSKAHQAIYIINQPSLYLYSPVLIYCSQRNIKVLPDSLSVIKHLQNKTIANYIVYTVNSNLEIIAKKEFNDRSR